MQRKIERLERIKNDQKEQLEKTGTALLQSRVEQSRPKKTKKPSTKSPKASAQKTATLKTPAKAKKSRPTAKSKAPTKKVARVKDDLTKLHGIGPKVAALLNSHGVETFGELSEMKIRVLRQWLKDDGKSTAIINPSSWPKQAKWGKSDHWQKIETWKKEVLKN